MTLMPPDESKPVIAAVSGAHMDRPVVTTAGLLAREYRASLILLYVIEVSRKDPVEASSDVTLGSAEVLLATAERILPAENQVSVRTEIRQARSASIAIIETSLRSQAQSVVVGAHRFLGEHECDLGDTATHVLRHSPIPVVVCYDPIR